MSQGKVTLPLYFLSLGGSTQVQEGAVFCKSPRIPASSRRPGLSQRGALVGQATHWLRKAKRYLMTTMTTRGRVMRICWIWCTLSAGFSSSVTKGAFFFRASFILTDPCKHLQAYLQGLCGSDSKESACNARHLGSVPALGRSPGGGHGNPLQYSGLERAWQPTPVFWPGESLWTEEPSRL